jgi:hypothetical protein
VADNLLYIQTPINQLIFRRLLILTTRSSSVSPCKCRQQQSHPLTPNVHTSPTNQKYLTSTVLKYSNCRNFSHLGPLTVCPYPSSIYASCSPPSPLDLISTLVDVGGDTSLAATRITEGQYLALVPTYFLSFLYLRTCGAMGCCNTKKGQKNRGSD